MNSGPTARRACGGAWPCQRFGSRLEGLNKDYVTTKPIIISEYTYEVTRDAVDARPLGEVKVKGKAQPVTVYELIGMKEPAAVA